MRLHPLTFIASAALVTFTAAEAHQSTTTTQLWTSKLDTPIKRLLRAHRTTDDEERGITASGVETLANTLKSTTNIDDELKALVAKGESADDAFKLLTLDKAADDLLSNPKLQSWISHLELFNEQNPSKKTTLIATLTAHYGDEALTRIIEQGKRVASTEATANRIQAKQFEAWLAGGQSADDVFKLLALDKAKEELIGSPLLDSWLGYMKFFNKEKPKKQTSLISTLAAHYNEFELAEMIGSARKVPSTAVFADRLETEQVYRWIETEATRTPDDMYTMLKLDKATTNLFELPQVTAWMKYMAAYNNKNPKEKVSFLKSWEYVVEDEKEVWKLVDSPLRKAYNDEELVTMLIAAKKVPSTEKMARRVQAELTQSWMKDPKNHLPDDIFDLLKLTDKETLLGDPLFSAWLKYLDEFNYRFPRYEDSAISTLLDKFSSVSLLEMIQAASKNPKTEAIAKRLDTEIVEKWFQNGNTPGSVYNLLRLNNDGDKVLESPFLPSWLKFTEYFNSKQIPKDQVSAISVLRNEFKDEILAKMLIEAHKKESTKKTAFDLLGDVMGYWLSKRRNPSRVYAWLRLQDKPRNKDVVELMQQYIDLFTKATK